MLSNLSCVFSIVILSLILKNAGAASNQDKSVQAKDEKRQVEYSLFADSVSGFNGKFFEAQGNVEIRGGGKILKAEKLNYTPNSGQVVGEGAVQLKVKGNLISGDSLKYNIVENTGFIENTQYQLDEPKARGTARKILALSSKSYVVEDGTYTTCQAENNDWYLKIKKLKVDDVKDLGVARNALVIFKNTPILYAPYLDFSLTGRRKSGLLVPSAGQTAQSGTELRLPYYWNIRPNMDATISPRIMSRRGLQVNQEIRYIRPNLKSDIQFEYLSDDQLYNDSRWAYAITQEYRLGSKITGRLSLQSVSDDTYFTDLSDTIDATSLTNLPREFGLTYDGGWFSGVARVQTFKTLQDPLDIVTPPYERAPQIQLFGNKKTSFGPDIEIRGELVEFQHPTLLNARRDVFYPSLKWPIRSSYAYVTPKWGYHYSRYTFDGSVNDTDRRLPIYSIDSGMTFERTTKLFDNNFLQTLEPRLYYVYIPFREQGHIPSFDTAESDFNLAQIFTENIFTGSDRINDADQLTAAVSSQFLSPETGEERLRLTLAQRYYFSDQKVGIDSTYVPRTSNRSDVLFGVNGQLNSYLLANIIAQYSLVEDQWERSSVMFQYRAREDKLINIGYRFTRDFVEQLDWSLQWPFRQSWTALARWNYSTRDKQLIEGILGVEFDAQCWKTRMVAHCFASATDEYATSFFFQLELRGLSKLGLNPLDVLKQNIRGYGKK